MPYNEESYENSVIELFKELGYMHLYGPEIERNFRNPLIESCLIESIKRIRINEIKVSRNKTRT